MALTGFISLLDNEIRDTEEESFALFTNPIASSNLGFIDPKAKTLSIALNNRDVTITQSPSLLTSSLPGGTTGAVLWKVTPLFASWMASRYNPLFTASILGPDSTVLELGAGVSGLVALATARQLGRYIVTDQEYVMKILRQNIAENLSGSKSRSHPKAAKRGKHAPPTDSRSSEMGNITLLPLDWETSSISLLPSLLPSSSPVSGLDAILACDCIYNEALIPPFVRTCAELCQLRSSGPCSEETQPRQPTIVLVAQQLRSHLVFEEWLRVFGRRFRVWRLPEEMMGEEMGLAKGFVVHVGILKEDMEGR